MAVFVFVESCLTTEASERRKAYCLHRYNLKTSLYLTDSTTWESLTHFKATSKDISKFVSVSLLRGKSSVRRLEQSPLVSSSHSILEQN